MQIDPGSSNDLVPADPPESMTGLRTSQRSVKTEGLERVTEDDLLSVIQECEFYGKRDRQPSRMEAKQDYPP